jgi:hypothetical protein
LGIKTLDNPYKLIAADANGSKSITAIDLVEIRKLILGINDKFPKVPSWVFIAKEGGITDVASPFHFKNHIETGKITKDMDDLDFVAVKMGDVNDTAFDFGDNSTERRNLVKPFTVYLSIENNNGQKYLTFRSSEDIQLDGLQLFMTTPYTKFIDESATNNQAKAMEHAIHLQDDNLNFLMYGGQSSLIQKGEILYRMAIKDDLDLHSIKLNREMISEAYINQESRKLLLKYKDGEFTKTNIKLVTNPVTDDLHLSINDLDKDDQMNCQIINMDGKILLSSIIDVSTNISEYVLPLNDQITPGMYLLNTKLGDNIQSTKFIRIR